MSSSRSGFPFHWAIYRWLEGETFNLQSGVDESAAAEHLANFVTTFRRTDPSGAPKARRSMPLSMLDRATRAAMDALDGIVNTHAVRSVWESCLQAPEWHGHPVWTHRDLIPSNILVDRGRISAIIDFGSVGIEIRLST